DKRFSFSFYSRLTKSEQVRLCAAWTNLAYLMAVDGRIGGSEVGDQTREKEFTKILPIEIAQDLQKVLIDKGEIKEFKDYEDFQLRLPQIEMVLSEARASLIKSGIEQTSEFQEKLDDKITGNGFRYRVEDTTARDYA